jgi:hypothetical protein
MRFILLIYANEADWETKSPAEKEAVMRAHATLDADLQNAGKYGACDALQSTRTATSVRIRNGRTLVTDGPFAETKEQLAGFYLIDAKDLNEAIQLASKIPPARVGSIEVRPTRELSV